MMYQLRLKNGRLDDHEYLYLDVAEKAALEQGAISVVSVQDVRTYPRLLTDDQRYEIIDYLDAQDLPESEQDVDWDFLETVPDTEFIIQGLLLGAPKWQDEFRIKIEEACRLFPEVVEPLVNAVRSLLAPSDIPY